MEEAGVDMKVRTIQKRPFGILILVTLSCLTGIIYFLSFILSLVPPSLSSIVLIFGSIYLIVSYGLWKGTAWAWWAYVILLAINIIWSLSTFPQNIMGVIGILFRIFIIWYLFQPHVKRYFNITFK